MSWRYEARLSGSGGQGLILAGKILAEAAAIYENKNATQSQSYGPEARGGASRSEVIIADGDIDFPKATRLDLLLSLTQEACDKYVCDLKDDGLLIVDSRCLASEQLDLFCAGGGALFFKPCVGPRQSLGVKQGSRKRFDGSRLRSHSLARHHHHQGLENTLRTFL